MPLHCPGLAGIVPSGRAPLSPSQLCSQPSGLQHCTRSPSDRRLCNPQPWELLGAPGWIQSSEGQGSAEGLTIGRAAQAHSSSLGLVWEEANPYLPPLPQPPSSPASCLQKKRAFYFYMVSHGGAVAMVTNRLVLKSGSHGGTCLDPRDMWKSCGRKAWGRQWDLKAMASTSALRPSQAHLYLPSSPHHPVCHPRLLSQAPSSRDNSPSGREMEGKAETGLCLQQEPRQLG